MDFNIVLDCYKNYWLSAFNFKGRTRRRDYWIAAFVNIALSFILFYLGELLGFMMPFYNFFSMITFIPSLSLHVRRLHDIGKRGWFLAVALVPLLGLILLVMWFIGEGQPGANKYGENPKEADTVSK